MEASPRPALPLLLNGLALCVLGALPLLEVGYTMRTSPLHALTVFDKSAIQLSGLLVAIGAAHLLSYWSKLSVSFALIAAKALAAALAVAAVANAALLVSVASHRGLATPWKASTYVNDETLFEQQVNDVFCHAKGLQVCELGSVAEARQFFPLQNWPVDSDRIPGRRITSRCEGFQKRVQLWDYQSKMEVCRLCGTVMAKEGALQEKYGPQHTAEVLAAVAVLSFGELQWCGDYLVLKRSDQDVGRSPYWKHRTEFQTLLTKEASPFTLVLAVRALQLSEVVASLCCLMLLRWYWTLQTTELEQHSTEGKAEVV